MIYHPCFHAGVAYIPVTADIAFLIDGSRYVGRRNFHLEKVFIKSIARRFTITKHQSHIGVATYGSHPHLRMRFNQYKSLGLVLRALDYIRYPNQNGRRVDLGMNAALSYFFNRRSKYYFVQKILVVVVSGRQTRWSYYLMRRLRTQFAKLGVKVYVVGVGRIDYKYLRPITYKNRHLYTVRSYRSLVTRAGQIARAIHIEMVRLLNPHFSNREQEKALACVSQKTRKLYGPEKLFVKLRPAYSVKLGFLYVVKGRKVKITAKFRDTEHLRFEDTKIIMSPEKFRDF